MLLGVFLAAITTEVAYQVLKRENRAPQRIELVIPSGTAQNIADGEAPPSIPDTNPKTKAYLSFLILSKPGFDKLYFER